MKRKVCFFSLLVALVICGLLAIQNKKRRPSINTDTMTSEIEIPAGGEETEVQTLDSTDDDSLDENVGENIDDTNDYQYDSINDSSNATDVSPDDLSDGKVQEDYHDDNEENIVTPEL